MSSVIKSSNIVGVYTLKDRKLEEKRKKKIKDIEKESKETKESPENPVKDDKIIEAENRADIIINEANSKAEEIIKEAEKKANQIVEEAENGSEEILNKAREKGQELGYTEGFEIAEKKGYQEGLARTAEARSTMEKVIADIQEGLENEVEQLSEEIVALSVRIASRIVNTELDIQPGIINNIIEEIIRDMRSVEKVDIFIHPDLLDYINEKKIENTLLKQIVNIKADNKLEKGDCIVESELGGRDGSLETKLELVEKELLKGAGFYEET